MKRIALNGRFTSTVEPSGTQIAAYHLFDQLVRRNRDFELVFFGDTRFPGVAAWSDLPGTTVHHIPLRDWPHQAGHLWEQLVLPLLCLRHGCRVVHHPITTCSTWHPACRSVVTLHDLNFHLHPEWYARSFRLAYRLFALPGIRRADRVVTISNYIREQALRVLHVPEEKLRRVYNGVKPLLPGGAAPLPGRYLLCVGSLPPHKNLVRMIEAFVAIREEFPGLELRIVGRPHPRQGSGDSRLPALLAEPGVRVLGYLSEADLAQAYGGAAAYAYASLEEGFGLPVLEAMSVGTPVLTSNVSCLPEIAGTAAVLVDPYSVGAIADGLRTILRRSDAEREAADAAGRAWAARFSWEASADRYLEIYRELF